MPRSSTKLDFLLHNLFSFIYQFYSLSLLFHVATLSAHPIARRLVFEFFFSFAIVFFLRGGGGIDCRRPKMDVRKGFGLNSILMVPTELSIGWLVSISISIANHVFNCPLNHSECHRKESKMGLFPRKLNFLLHHSFRMFISGHLFH